MSIAPHLSEKLFSLFSLPKARRASTLNNKFNVLLVEDDPTTRAYLTYLLKKADIIVTTAADGETGLQILKERKKQKREFNLLVFDLSLPCLSGAELAEAAKQLGVRCPIIGVTSTTDTQELNATGLMYFDSILKKVEVPRRLLALIAKTIYRDSSGIEMID